MLSPTNVAAVDLVLLTQEGIRQQAVAVATTQAEINTAQAVFEAAVLSAKIAAGLDVGNEIGALQDQLGVQV
jgi:hypothetical protein